MGMKFDSYPSQYCYDMYLIRSTGERKYISTYYLSQLKTNPDFFWALIEHLKTKVVLPERIILPSDQEGIEQVEFLRKWMTSQHYLLDISNNLQLSQSNKTKQVNTSAKIES